MAARKKPGTERAWKIAAVERLITEQLQLISRLEATVREFPEGTPIACPNCWAGNDICKANPRCEHCGGVGVPSDFPTRAKRALEGSPGNSFSAYERLAELKRLKRHPGTLCTAAELLRSKQLTDEEKSQSESHGKPLSEAEISRGRHCTALDHFKDVEASKAAEDMVAAVEGLEAQLVAKHGSVDAFFKHREAQRKLAKKPRGRGIAGRTTHEVVADTVGRRSDETTSELLEDVKFALRDNGIYGNRGKKEITNKWVGESIRRVRRARTPSLSRPPLDPRTRRKDSGK